MKSFVYLTAGIACIITSSVALAVIALFVIAVKNFDVSSSMIGYEEFIYWAIIILLEAGKMALGFDLIRHRNEPPCYEELHA